MSIPANWSYTPDDAFDWVRVIPEVVTYPEEIAWSINFHDHASFGEWVVPPEWKVIKEEATRSAAGGKYYYVSDKTYNEFARDDEFSLHAIIPAFNGYFWATTKSSYESTFKKAIDGFQLILEKDIPASRWFSLSFADLGITLSFPAWYLVPTNTPSSLTFLHEGKALRISRDFTRDLNNMLPCSSPESTNCLPLDMFSIPNQKLLLENVKVAKIGEGQNQKIILQHLTPNVEIQLDLQDSTHLPPVLQDILLSIRTIDSETPELQNTAGVTEAGGAFSFRYPDELRAVNISDEYKTQEYVFVQQGYSLKEEQKEICKGETFFQYICPQDELLRARIKIKDYSSPTSFAEAAESEGLSLHNSLITKFYMVHGKLMAESSAKRYVVRVSAYRYIYIKIDNAFEVLGQDVNVKARDLIISTFKTNVGTTLE